MKIQNVTRLNVLSKVQKQGIKDPTKTYYSLVVMQDEDAGSLSCSKEVFDSVVDGATVDLVTEFNQQYNSYRVVGVVKTVNK